MKFFEPRRCHDIWEAIARVHEHGQFIQGPEVQLLEDALKDLTGAAHCITCANGTDALELALRAYGVGEGHAVFVPAFTFVATAGAASMAGATPVFVDIDESTYTMDPDSLEEAIAVAKKENLDPGAVIPVDLFGMTADYYRFAEIAERHNKMPIISDAAQSLGAQDVGLRGDATCTSFFPTKPLGCYGDGGAIFTNNDQIEDRIRAMAHHGRHVYGYDWPGRNSRLDTIQAAVLLGQLEFFDHDRQRRRDIASRYVAGINNPEDEMVRFYSSIWANYTMRLRKRNVVSSGLGQKGIPTKIYYSAPLYANKAFRCAPRVECPIAEKVCREVLSLPIHPQMSDDDVERVIGAVNACQV